MTLHRKTIITFIDTDKGTIILMRGIGGVVRAVGPFSWVKDHPQPQLLVVQRVTYEMATDDSTQPSLSIELTREVPRRMRVFTAVSVKSTNKLVSLGPTWLAVTPSYTASFHIFGQGPDSAWMSLLDERTRTFAQRTIGSVTSESELDGSGKVTYARLPEGAPTNLDYRWLFDCSTGRLTVREMAFKPM